jgi:hypothetical protein
VLDVPGRSHRQTYEDLVDACAMLFQVVSHAGLRRRVLRQALGVVVRCRVAVPASEGVFSFIRCSTTGTVGLNFSGPR